MVVVSVSVSVTVTVAVIVIVGAARLQWSVRAGSGNEGDIDSRKRDCR